MKVQARHTTKIVQNEALITIFIEGKIYNSYKNNIEWAFFVIDELGRTNIYCENAFKKSFSIIEN